MTTVTVLPESTGSSPHVYRATAGGHEAIGETVAEAFKSLSDQLGEPKETTLVIVQPMKPDQYFTAGQIRRLGELMAKWRTARDSGSSLSATEQAELEALVEAELAGTIERSKALLKQARQ
jgi:phenylpyruvate tautomerase PptA (4-oxalocrotonate tautomerase family)